MGSHFHWYGDSKLNSFKALFFSIIFTTLADAKATGFTEEFNGMVERVTELNLDDDIYHDKAKVTNFTHDEPLRKLSED